MTKESTFEILGCCIFNILAILPQFWLKNGSWQDNLQFTGLIEIMKGLGAIPILRHQTISDFDTPPPCHILVIQIFSSQTPPPFHFGKAFKYIDFKKIMSYISHTKIFESRDPPPPPVWWRNIGMAPYWLNKFQQKLVKNKSLQIRNKKIEKNDFFLKKKKFFFFENCFFEKKISKIVFSKKLFSKIVFSKKKFRKKMFFFLQKKSFFSIFFFRIGKLLFFTSFCWNWFH